MGIVPIVVAVAASLFVAFLVDATMVIFVAVVVVDDEEDDVVAVRLGALVAHGG